MDKLELDVVVEATIDFLSGYLCQSYCVISQDNQSSLINLTKANSLPRFHSVAVITSDSEESA